MLVAFLAWRGSSTFTAPLSPRQNFREKSDWVQLASVELAYEAVDGYSPSLPEPRAIISIHFHEIGRKPTGEDEVRSKKRKKNLLHLRQRFPGGKMSRSMERGEAWLEKSYGPSLKGSRTAD